LYITITICTSYNNCKTQNSMKASFFSIIIALFAIAPLAANAQHVFPLTELQKFCAQNSSDFETFMLTNDYSLQSKLSNPVSKVYWSDKTGISDKKYTITRSQVPNAVANILFTNTDKKWYLEVKKQLAATGYKFVKEENKTVNGAQATGSNFSNGTFQVSIYTYTTDVPYYVIQIHL